MKNAEAVLQAVPGELVSAKVVGRYLGLATKTILSWAELNKIPHYKFGTGKKAPVRFNLDEILSWMQGWKKGPESGYHTLAESVASRAQERR